MSAHRGPLFDRAKFEARLREQIERLGIDQKTAAEAIGVNPSTICRILLHHRSPTVETYLRISDWLAEQRRIRKQGR